MAENWIRWYLGYDSMIQWTTLFIWTQRQLGLKLIMRMSESWPNDSNAVHCSIINDTDMWEILIHQYSELISQLLTRFQPTFRLPRHYNILTIVSFPLANIYGRHRARYNSDTTLEMSIGTGTSPFSTREQLSSNNPNSITTENQNDLRGEGLNQRIPLSRTCSERRLVLFPIPLRILEYR
ncbi:hypothetical protein BT96DRAFT_916936 [Gymnopus androsaceus JB14]|uniref:Uncharacterized protein n=1 Tax=Gymnopus androsaceus JB14 TaxID=1447944 RepID=A0A6A4I347_9AGAR|nr:hypothetical protein BT96DRAFT_916936 [Gymnopus androsaceus JB14]